MTSPSESFFYVYGQLDRSVFGEIRRETYGEDLGHFSWITADELRKFLGRLQVTTESHLLDVACGSGGPALFIAKTTGCRLSGIDINESGIASAQQQANTSGLHGRVSFQKTDAGGELPFEDGSFDAIISIDAMNHMPDRAGLLREWRRILRPNGRFLFTDATIVTGILSRDEILDRSRSMGNFLFTPAGMHERLIEDAGFTDLQVENVTCTIAAVTKRWRDAREKRRDELLKTETADQFESLQKMLGSAHALARDGRLSRFAYSARKPGPN